MSSAECVECSCRITTDLYRKRPGGTEPNERVVVGAGRFGPSRKEEFADVCEGCSRFWQRTAMGFIDFRRLLVCEAGGNCLCRAIRHDTAKHHYPPNHATAELTDLADQRARVASLASASSF